MKASRKFGRLPLMLGALLLLVVTSADAAVQAWLNNHQVAPGDSVQLTLQMDQQTSDQPDLGPLKQDFDVLSTSRGSSVQIINGSVTSRTQLQVMLSPKRSGQLTVPAIRWGNDSSAPLTLTVTNAAANGSNAPASDNAVGNGKVFVQTSVDTAQPYVQAEVNVTVRLYTQQPLYKASLDLPASNDVLVQQVGSDQSSTVVRNGQRYQLIERHYALFPQHSGKMSLSGAILNAQVAVQNRNDPFNDDAFQDFFGNSPFNDLITSTQPIRVHGDAIQLNVRARPAAATGNYWLPAHEVTVTAQWHPDSAQVQAGDPITVDLHVQAKGLTAAQLPDPASLLNLPNGVKAYPDQAKLDNKTQGDTVIGTRDQSVALIADQAGTFTVQSVSLHWWDTQADAPREIVLSARTLTVAPSANGNHAATAMQPASPSATPIPAQSDKQSGAVITNGSKAMKDRVNWLWISATFALLWLLTVVAWLWSRRRKVSITTTSPRPVNVAAPPDASGARNAFHDACRRNDAPAARRNLLAWANAVCTDNPPTGLQALSKVLSARADNAALTSLLLDLDRACYAGESWNGAALSQALRELPSQKKSSDRNAELAPLYH
jgi:hypothetical protein